MKFMAGRAARRRRRAVVPFRLCTFGSPWVCFHAESWLPVGYSTHL